MHRQSPARPLHLIANRSPTTNDDYTSPPEGYRAQSHGYQTMPAQTMPHRDETHPTAGLDGHRRRRRRHEPSRGVEPPDDKPCPATGYKRQLHQREPSGREELHKGDTNAHTGYRRQRRPSGEGGVQSLNDDMPLRWVRMPTTTMQAQRRKDPQRRYLPHRWVRAATTATRAPRSRGGSHNSETQPC